MKSVSRLLDFYWTVLWKSPGVAGRVQRAWRVFRKAGWRGMRWELGRRIAGHNDYVRWVRDYDTPTPEARNRISQRVAAMQTRPLISVVMPAYNPNPSWLREAIESVRAQIYPNWELCIADDASPSPEVRAVLQSYAESDPRIKVVFRPKNGHISAASNSALEVASGTWIALMDHDDLLPADALFWVADCIAAHPDVRLIYSDEDKVDEAGNRSGPYFKSDWNIDLFRSQNMFSHLGVLSMDLVRAVGGFRQGLEGSQDWDLVLRCMEHVEARQIRHIPRVLYHWRVHAESTAKSMNAKPYAALAGERALNEHFERTHVRATAEYLGFGYRARYALPESLPLVSLVISTRNAAASLRRCVNSIVGNTTYARFEIVIADNASDDTSTRDYYQSVAQMQNIRVLRHEEVLDDGALKNSAVEAAQGEVIALLDDSLEVITPEWLSEMVSLALQPGVGAVGTRLWHRSRTLQHAGIILGLGPDGVAGFSHQGMPGGREGYAGRAALIQSLSAVTGACLVIRKVHYQQAGGFDADHLKQAFADVDFCLRLGELGLRTVWTPYAELVHHVPAGSTAKRGAQASGAYLQDVAYMKQRWGTLLQNDPAYNPNLMLTPEDFSYAWPPRLDPV
ncbi:MAG: glycosyl transferase family 2 [Variovorax sp. 67-131]|nr:glycosyltransferase [Variovorax sp.]ODU13404.1 MAG: glycosyl transferase family 2 [Variovorax sp. SCN 67-85]ODV23069.1 MAG: glycosyl transferase family 2 [Variovorax sp. SCN 67-20]OJZ12918.1 MAG: glycosyl transferase family 2 [Variovorax sp. 67-131]